MGIGNRFIPLEEAESVISSNGSNLPVRTSGPGLSAAKSTSASDKTTAAAANRPDKVDKQKPATKVCFHLDSFKPPPYCNAAY